MEKNEKGNEVADKASGGGSQSFDYMRDEEVWT